MSEYTRLTGMFKSQSNPKCFSGSVQGEYLDQLANAIRQAKQSDRAVVMYFWNNGPKPCALSFKIGDPPAGGQQRAYQKKTQGTGQRSNYQPYRKKEPEIPVEEPVFDDDFGDAEAAPF